jgi:cell division protease FtsH
MADFEEAKDKVMLGAERRSLVMTEEDKRLSAYHEAGHALVAKLLPGAQPIHKATIIPRGQAMGMVSFLADERRSITETRLRAHLATALGGCCAEKLIFNERSTGAQGDYKQVTALARSMVCDWGMNHGLGPLSLGGEDDEIFVGREFARRRAFSDRTAEAIDQEVRELVLDAERIATELLRQHLDRLRLLAGALLEFEVLDDVEIDRILAGEPLTRQARPRHPEGSTPVDEAAGAAAGPADAIPESGEPSPAGGGTPS